MVRKQNERTLLLQYRINPLSLPTNLILSYFSVPRPLSTRLGAFSSPETFSHKFFPKFFPIRPRRLFSVFLVRKIMFSWGELFSTFMARKIMGMKCTCRSAIGGGCPFLPALSAYSAGASVLPAFPLSGRQFSAYRGKFSAKRGKSE